MTGIQWTDETWNPVGGCSKVSAGCTNCYAERMDVRLRAIAGEDFRPWHAGNAAYNVRLHPERLETPLRWRKPRRVFVNSMSDLFHPDVPEEFIDRVFAVMALCPQHTFQVLTKRPERMRAYLTAGTARQAVLGGGSVPTEFGCGTTAYDRVFHEMAGSEAGRAWRRANPSGDFLGSDGPLPRWPLGNCWLGVSVEDQETADRRIPELLATPAAVRFISAEPLLGPVDLTELPRADGWAKDALSGWNHGSRRKDGLWGVSRSDPDHRLSWVIVGGESGPQARPCDLAWIRSIVAQCQAAGVAVFVKQLGAKLQARRDAQGEAPVQSPAVEPPQSHLAGTLANWMVDVIGYEPEPRP